MILRLIGIVILVLLGLMLSALLLVLFVPVRYFMSGSYNDKAYLSGYPAAQVSDEADVQPSLKAEVKITWFLHMVSIRAVYEEGLDIVVKLLGIRLFQGGKSPKEAGDEIKEAAEELGEGLAEIYESELESEDFRKESPETIDIRPESGEELREAAGRDSGMDGDHTAWDDLEDHMPEQEGECFDSRTSRKNAKKSKGKGRKEEKKQNFSGPKERAAALVKSIKARWNRILEYKEKGTAFFQDEENQKTIKLILRQCKALICHILPKKIRGRITFGFDDPSVTGNILVVLSILYAWYGDAVEVTPVFDQKIVDVEGSLKGRIRAGTLLALVIRVLLNKNFRLLVRRWRRNGGI